MSEYATTIKALTHLIQQSSKDLQDQKQFSQDLLAKQKLFLRHAVHETVTPLAVIMSNIELYELENGKNEQLSNIEVAMKNVYNIYDDLAYLVKKNQIQYPKMEIDLIDYLRSRIEFFKPFAMQSNLYIELILNVKNAGIYFNETKLQRIVDNNLTNAIKYTKENETIFIIIYKNNAEYKIEIKSKSSHIQNKKKIFEAYYREEDSSAGFGLGLNLVKQICDEESIDIELVSDEKTTSFSYTFKREKDEDTTT